MGGKGGGRGSCVWGLVMGFPLVAAGGGVRGHARPWGSGASRVGWCLRVVSRWSGPGGREGGGGVWGWHCWGGGVGLGVAQVGRLSVPLGLVGDVFVRRAGHVAPGWPWCRGGRWLPGIPGWAAVCRRWPAVGGRCSQAEAAVEGAVGDSWVLRAGLGVVGVRTRPSVGLWGRIVARVLSARA